MSTPTQGTAHAEARRASTANIGAYIAITLEQLLLRALALSPLIYAISARRFFGAPRAHYAAIALLCCIPLWVLLVLPFRYRAGGQLSGWLRREGPPTAINAYSQWLGRGLLYLVQVLPWLLPLMAYLGAYYYYMNIAVITTFMSMIRGVGGLIGGDYVHGVILLALLLLVCLVLAIWGWYHRMPLFYLPWRPSNENDARLHALHHANPKGLRGVVFKNLLLVLPALILVGYILVSSLTTRMTGDIQMDLMIVLPAITSFDFPKNDLTAMGIALALVYLPFVLYRKAALAAAIHRSADRA